jgi:hypothetical protein
MAELPGAIDHLREKAADLLEPEQLQHALVVAAAPEAAVARDGGGGVGRALARAAEIEPVLGLEDGGCPFDQLRPVPQQLCELCALTTGIERAAGDLVHLSLDALPAPRLDDR